MDLVEKYLGEGFGGSKRRVRPSGDRQKIDPAKRAEMIKKRKEYEKSSKGRAMAKKRQLRDRQMDRQGGKGRSTGKRIKSFGG